MTAQPPSPAVEHREQGRVVVQRHEKDDGRRLHVYRWVKPATPAKKKKGRRP